MQPNDEQEILRLDDSRTADYFGGLRTESADSVWRAEQLQEVSVSVHGRHVEIKGLGNTDFIGSGESIIEGFKKIKYEAKEVKSNKLNKTNKK